MGYRRTRRLYWGNIPPPDHHWRLQSDLEPMTGSISGTYNPGVAGDPLYTDVLGGGARGMIGLDCSAANQGRVDVTGQAYRGDRGSIFISILPSWNWNDGVQHVFATLSPLDATALSGLVLEKSAANQIKMSVITNNGASLITALFAATNLITAYQPFIISAYWKLNDIKIFLNYANSKQTTTCPVGTATQSAPKAYIGNSITAAPLYTEYASSAGGLVSNVAVWKECHSEDEFHRRLYVHWKNRLARAA